MQMIDGLESCVFLTEVRLLVVTTHILFVGVKPGGMYSRNFYRVFISYWEIDMEMKLIAVFMRL